MNANDQPKVLVIGATSSIGQFLVQELAAQPGTQNVRVLAAVRSEQKAESFHKEGTLNGGTSLITRKSHQTTTWQNVHCVWQ